MSYSIVIPAHNEECVIKKALCNLLEGADIGSRDLIVVANGCADQTAAQARSVDPRINVIELPIGSKPNALNEGDRLATCFPRIYMDADVQISNRGLVNLVDYMKRTGVPAAAPVAVMDFKKASGRQVSWLVRAYYKVWFSLPYVQGGMVGCGVYALSEEGRSRFDKFPDIVSDDGFVRAHFTNEERPVVEDCVVTVCAPQTLWGLIKIKTRSRLGGRQLRQCYPRLFEKELANPRWRTLSWYLFKPNLWFAMPCYLLVVAVSLWRSQRQYKRQDFSVWERDDTSRKFVTDGSRV